MSTGAKDLMEALARITRDERLREELERLAAGRLSAAEVAELERRAGSDEALREAIELCRPRPAELHLRLARAALAQLAAAAPKEQEPEGPRPIIDLTAKREALAARHPGATATDGAEPARKVSTPWRRRAAWGSAVTAVAAAAALFVSLRGGPEPLSLPDYALEVSVRSEYRAGPAPDAVGEPIAIAPGEPIELVLRPSVAVEAPVEAWFFAERAGPASERGVSTLALAIEVDASGAVRATGTAGEWADGGALVVAIGPAGRAPGLADVRARARPWRWITRSIRPLR